MKHARPDYEANPRRTWEHKLAIAVALLLVAVAAGALWGLYSNRDRRCPAAVEDANGIITVPPGSCVTIPLDKPAAKQGGDAPVSNLT